MKTINYMFLLPIILFNIISNSASAQLNPLGAMYYQNQYLGNAAFAGIDTGINIGLAYRKQWSTISGAPRNQAITAAYRFGKVGLGLNFYNDKAGLLNRTRTVATYAYHLPLNANNQQLHFGLSLGFLNQRIYENEVVGTTGDAAIGTLNQRDTYIDGDFGAAYATNNLTIQGSLPNLKSFFKQGERGTTSNTTFFSAISYKLNFGQGQDAFNIEPKLAYRGIHGFNNLWDLGTNVTFASNQLNIFGMFHSTGSTTFGLGFLYKERMGLQGIYTSETTALRGNTNGNFELNLKIKVF